MSQNTAIPLNKLIAWAGNVRKTESDKGIDELAASIRAHGLLQSLVVRKDRDDTYAVVAGRRRLRALQSLAKVKHLPPDHPVPCQPIGDEADATEVSLAENVMREPMHPADEFDAFKRLIDKGTSPADVAARFGVTEAVVQKRLKLAKVSPKLVAAFRKGETGLQHMMAFAVTDDHAQQEKVWKELSQWEKTEPDGADNIREALIKDEISAADKRVKFITLKAYEKAGGGVTRDLFCDDEYGIFIADALLLKTLVTQKLEQIAEGVRKEGWKWVEVREKFDYSEGSRYKRVYETANPLPPKQQAELDSLNEEYDALSGADDGEEDNPRMDELADKIAKLEGHGTRKWQPDMLAIAGAVIAIGYEGKPDITRGLVKPGDMPKPTKTVAKRRADGSIVEETVQQRVLSAVLIESLTTHRTAALAATLIDTPKVALPAIVHTLAAQLNGGRSSDDGCFQISLRQCTMPDVEGSKAHKAIEAAAGKWRKLPKDDTKLWAWCLKQKPAVLLELLAFCLARSLDAIEMKHNQLAGGRGENADAVAKAVNLDIGQWYQPTAENYFGRIAKPAIIEALTDAKVPVTPAMEKAKRGDLALIAEREIAKSGWLPELLRKPK